MEIQAYKKSNLLSQLADLDSIKDARALTDDEIVKKASLLMEYEECIKMKQAWGQRSKTLWLKERDGNTKFFHKVDNAHKRNNNIDHLVIQGEIIEEPGRKN